MNSLVKFIKSSSIYFIGNVLTKLVTFFLLPLYTVYISTDKMGYFNETYSIVSVLITVVFFDVWSVIMLYIMNRQDEEDPYKTLFNGMTLFSFSMLLYLVGGFAVGEIFDIRYLFFILVYGVVIALQNCYSYIARAFGHNATFALSGIIGTLVSALSNILLILRFHWEIESLYVSAILGLFVQIVIMECKVKVLSHLSFRYFDKALIFKMLKFSLPLALSNVGFWFLSSYNQVGISSILGEAQNGVYSVAAKFTYVLTLVSGCFNMAWQEMAYAFNGDKEDKGKLYTVASGYFLRFLMFGILLLLPFIEVIYPFFVRGEYTVGVYSLIPLYLLAAVANMYSNFLGNIFTAERKTGEIFLSTIAAAVTNVTVFHLLVGRIGLQAASVALLSGFLVNILLRLILLRKHTTIHPPLGMLALTALLFIGTSYVYLAHPVWDLATSTLLPSGAVWTGGAFLLLFLAALFSFKDILKLFFSKLPFGGKKKS